jgi:hypothetical protein
VAVIAVLGANEFYRYDPVVFVEDPDEAAPPPLLGNDPIELSPNATVSGVFREDELAEAAQDLDAITRAGVVPEFAELTEWPTQDVTGGSGGAEFPSGSIPGAAIPALLAIDVSFRGTTHMVLEYVLRVRDREDRLRPNELDPTLLVAPSSASYVPPPPPP